MKKYGYLQAIYMSFFSRNLYQDVAKNWGAGVVLYLFILLAICWAVTMARFQPSINTSFKLLVAKYGQQLPEIKIENGQASTPESKPYVLKDPDTEESFAIVDTSGKYKNISEVPKGVQILVTKDKIFYMDKDNAVKIQKIPSSLTMDIKPDQVKEKLTRFVSWSWVLFFPILLFLSFIYRLVQALVYAVIGKIFAALANVPLSYSEVLKLCMIAVTPAVILSTILDWFAIDFSFEWLMYFIISMGYLIFAINANRKTPA